MPRRACLFMLLATLVIAETLVAQPAFLVEDINPYGTAPILPSNQELTGLGTDLFFVNSDGVHGYEIWKSDGTGPGTALLIDLCPGICSSLPTSLTVFDGFLFFFADDGVHGRELWKSDGTAAGTTLVKDIYPGMGNREHFRPGSPGGLLAADGVLYFAADDREHGLELWKSDGTPEGTLLVRDIYLGPNGSDPRPWVAAGGILLLNADDGTHGREPWASDGTAAGTNLIQDINSGSASSTSALPGNAGQDAIAAPGGGFLFQADNGSLGQELWRTDGTEAGTTLVKDISPGGGSEPAGFATLGATVYFSARDTLNGRELWKTDGTEAGTTLVKDINPDQGSSPSEITASGSRIFFRAFDNSHGFELWSSDGTEAGTLLVRDIFPGAVGGLAAPPNAITAFDGGVLFLVVGRGLWRSDGSEAGTVQIPGSPDLPAVEFVRESWARVGGSFFFSAFGHVYSGPPTLWKSDGLSASKIPTSPPAPWSIRAD
ncbi:MAG TPA: ELWxxDGT repeat protein, partial [Thermoanaerobaculia bacterium]